MAIKSPEALARKRAKVHAYQKKLRQEKRDWNTLNREKYLEYQRNYRKTPEGLAKKKAKQKEWNERIKKAVLDHYGHSCKCCGETMNDFLTVDHIDGYITGPRAGTTLRKWLIDNNFPPGFQILCWNCNQAKYFYGTCPHKKS